MPEPMAGVAAERSPTVAVASLPEGSWVGFRRTSAAYRFMAGDRLGRTVSGGGLPDERRVLVALVIAYFEEALEVPPPDVTAATQQDMAELLRWLADSAPSAGERAALLEALDAVEDGLPGDAVALPLIPSAEAAGGGASAPETPIDAVGMLAARARALLEA